MVVSDDDHIGDSGRDEDLVERDEGREGVRDAEPDTDDALDSELDDADEFEAVDDEGSDAEDTEIDAFEDDDGDASEEGIDIDEVVELSSKEQSARSLEIRRALEERMERKQLSEDLDYLDLDDD